MFTLKLAVTVSSVTTQSSDGVIVSNEEKEADSFEFASSSCDR